MAVFSDLPFEIRTEIFQLALPDPRVLRIIRLEPKAKTITDRLRTLFSKTDSNSKTPPFFTVSPASYGGKHPAILSINRESRNEALKYLTKHLGVYWNLKTDFPYFEIHELRDQRVLLFTEMYRAGVLEPFHNIAMDQLVWSWPQHTNGYRELYAGEFLRIIGPVHILNAMPHLKQFVVTYTWHTLQADLTIPYQPWQLGTITDEVTLHPDWKKSTHYWRVKLSIGDRGFAERYPMNADAVYLRVKEGVEVSLMGIHGREREYFPPSKALRPSHLPPNHWG